MLIQMCSCLYAVLKFRSRAAFLQPKEEKGHRSRSSHNANMVTAADDNASVGSDWEVVEILEDAENANADLDIVLTLKKLRELYPGSEIYNVRDSSEQKRISNRIFDLKRVYKKGIINWRELLRKYDVSPGPWTLAKMKESRTDLVAAKRGGAKPTRAASSRAASSTRSLDEIPPLNNVAAEKPAEISVPCPPPIPSPFDAGFHSASQAQGNLARF